MAAARSVGMTRIAAVGLHHDEVLHPAAARSGSRSDQTMQSCDSCSTARSDDDVAARVLGPDPGERLPGADVVPGERPGHHRDGAAALEQADVDRDRRDRRKKPATSPASSRGSAGGDLGRVPRHLGAAARSAVQANRPLFQSAPAAIRSSAVAASGFSEKRATVRAHVVERRARARCSRSRSRAARATTPTVTSRSWARAVVQRARRRSAGTPRRRPRPSRRGATAPRPRDRAGAPPRWPRSAPARSTPRAARPGNSRPGA